MTRGGAHPRAKLTDRQVAEIRYMAKKGTTYRVIAVKFCISKGHVFNIVKFKQRTDINGVRVCTKL